MSNKRILPAVILASSAGFLGVHRFYAGRYITGLVQLVPFSAGFVMLMPVLTSLLGAMKNPDQLLDWVSSHQIQPLPVLLVAIPSFWALIDCILLALRRFRDGAGEKMTRWV